MLATANSSISPDRRGPPRSRTAGAWLWPTSTAMAAWTWPSTTATGHRHSISTRWGGEGNWISLKLVGSRSNRSAVGARVRLRAGGKTMTRQVEAGSGYSAQAMLPVHFGLGNASQIDKVEITWPSGHVQRFSRNQWAEAFGLNRLVRIAEDTPLTAALIGGGQ